MSGLWADTYTLLHIYNNNIGTDLFDIFIADVAVRILAQTGEPFAPVGYNNLLNTPITMIEFQVYDVTDTVAGS